MNSRLAIKIIRISCTNEFARLKQYKKLTIRKARCFIARRRLKKPNYGFSAYGLKMRKQYLQWAQQDSCNTIMRIGMSRAEAIANSTARGIASMTQAEAIADSTAQAVTK